MKNLPILVFESLVAILITVFGLSGRKFLFLQGARSSAILLGIIGMLFCAISVGKFISHAPANPITILGYIVGTVALFAFLAQVFKWNIPILGKPEAALIILTVAIIIKSLIARFSCLIIK